MKCLSKYLQMMKILNHISWTICQGFIQIINTYQVTIITYFMQNQTITALKMSGTSFMMLPSYLFHDVTLLVPLPWESFELSFFLFSLTAKANLKTFLDQTKEQNSALSVVGAKNLYTNMKIDTKIDQRPEKMFGMEPLIIGIFVEFVSILLLLSFPFSALLFA